MEHRTVTTWTDLESLVAEALIEDSYGDFDSDVVRRRYLHELKVANEQLLRLSAGLDVDYSLPRIGEAYALWYHMRRVANVFEAFSWFEEDLLRLSPSGQWRVIDIGAGTGAGSMALAAWMHSRSFSTARKAQTRVVTIEREGAMLEAADFILRRVARTLGNELPLLGLPKNVRRLSDVVHLPAYEVYEVALFSTTFDHLTAGALRDEAIGGILAVLERLLPDGLAFFLVPETETKLSFFREVQESLRERGGWTRLRKDMPAGLQVPAPGTVQQEIAKARSYFHRQGLQLGLPSGIFPPQREREYPPVYRNDVTVAVFRKDDTDALSRNIRRRLARQVMSRIDPGGATLPIKPDATAGG